jgi:hypothetical protein
MKAETMIRCAVLALLALALTGMPPKGSDAQQVPTEKPVAPPAVSAAADTAAAVSLKREIIDIGKKKETLKREIARAPLMHSVEDIYNLQIKTFTTLEDSHRLTLVVVGKNDSLKRLLSDTRKEGLLTQAFAAKSLKYQTDMKREMLTQKSFREQVALLENFLTKSAYVVSVLSILFWLGRIGMKEWHRRNEKNMAA